jgi:hypothetical protein
VTADTFGSANRSEAKEDSRPAATQNGSDERSDAFCAYTFDTHPSRLKRWAKIPLRNSMSLARDTHDGINKQVG